MLPPRCLSSRNIRIVVFLVFLFLANALIYSYYFNGQQQSFMIIDQPRHFQTQGNSSSSVLNGDRSPSSAIAGGNEGIGRAPPRNASQNLLTNGGQKPLTNADQNLFINPDSKASVNVAHDNKASVNVAHDNKASVSVAHDSKNNVSVGQDLNASTVRTDARQLAAELGLPPAEWMDQPVVNLFPYRFAHNQPTACSNRSVEVVIACPVSRANFDQRQAVRDTWGSYARDPANRAVLLFFLGSDVILASGNHSNQGLTEWSSALAVQHRIDEESALHKDIVQTDFSDTYRNLSMKSVSILSWIDGYCPQTDYVIKADDDMYVVVPSLVSKLKSKRGIMGQKPFVLGFKISGAIPVQDKSSKWHTPLEAFSEKVYPNYASGTTYAMTGPACRLLFQAALRTPSFWLEDVYVTGLCSRKAGVRVVNDGTMTYNKPTANGCAFRKFTTGHRYSVPEIRRIHRELYDINHVCL